MITCEFTVSCFEKKQKNNWKKKQVSVKITKMHQSSKNNYEKAGQNMKSQNYL